MSYSAVGAELLPSTFPTSTPTRTSSPALVASTFPGSVAPSPQLPTCVSQSVHDQAVLQCKNLAVKGVGLGVVGYEQYSSCALAAVPVCPSTQVYRQKPAAPPALVYQALPVATSMAPIAPYVPIPGPQPVATDKRNLIIGGLLAVLVVGGGVVAYRQLKKKKA